MYDFTAGLSQVERIEVLIGSPLLWLLGPALPVYGMATKPSAAEPAALLVVGAATLICGSDRAADRELRAHWPRLRRSFVAAGYRVPVEPLQSRHFRDYRDKVLGGSLPEEWKDDARGLYAGMSLQVELFPDSVRAWNDPHLDGVVTADGTWFRSASEVRGMKKSRSKTGSPRILKDTDRKNKGGRGYMFCIVSVRGEGPRKRVVLDIVHAPKSAEMKFVTPCILRLRERLGDRFRCFVYDGAMHGEDHRRFRKAGLVTVNKPKGLRRPDKWSRHLDTVVGEVAKIFDPDLGCGCRHLLTVTAGMFWEPESNTFNGYRRSRILEVAELRRVGPVKGEFSWELDLVVRCGHGDHVFTVDPNAEVACATGAELNASDGGRLRYGTTLNLSDKLRVLQANDDNFAKVYGRRNDSESGNHSLKSDFGLGHRAGSYSVERHDTDLWIYSLLANALVWEEYSWHARSTGAAVDAAAA